MKSEENTVTKVDPLGVWAIIPPVILEIGRNHFVWLRS